MTMTQQMPTHCMTRWAWPGLALLVVAAWTSPAHAEAGRCNANQVVREYEDLMRGDGQVALFEMRVVRPQSTRTLRMRFWFQNGRNGSQDRALARVEAPGAERGVASLRLGNKMWSFVPSTGRVQQVPESMMLGSWMGSDWTNDDLVRETSLLDDYRVTSCRVVDHDGPANRVELRAKSGREVTWPKLVVIARRGSPHNNLPLLQEFYSRRAGELILARTMTFSAFREMGGRMMPSRMVLEPTGRPGRRTELRYLNLQFNVTIPDRLFSLSNLQRSR
jgi:hypothetical protein